MSSNHKKRWAALALALALVLGLSSTAMGARQAQTPSPGVTQTSAPGVALLRMIQASPDAPPVNMFLNDDRAFCDLGFAAVTRYVYVNPGAYTVRVGEAPAAPGPPALSETPGPAISPRGPGAGPPAGVTPGAGGGPGLGPPSGAPRGRGLGPPPGVTPIGRPGFGPATAATPATAAATPATATVTAAATPAAPPATTTPRFVRALAAATVNLAASAAYSTVMVGPAGAAELLILQDDLSVPTAGSARVRFVNVSPNAPALDLAQTGAAPLSSGVAYKEASGYVDVPPGSISMELRAAGSSNVLATLPGASLAAGVVYTVYAMGTMNGQPPLQAVLVVESVEGMAVPTG